MQRAAGRSAPHCPLHQQLTESGVQARTAELQAQLQDAVQAQQLAERDRASLQQQAAGMQSQVSAVAPAAA